MADAQKHKYRFHASLDEAGGTDGAVLVLSGHIWPDENNASVAIAQALSKVRKHEKLTVLIRNLYGGDCDEGMTVYHDLVAYDPIVKVDGVVASMGTIIMLAGKSVEVSEHTKCMTHRPQGFVQGDYEDMKDRSEQNALTYQEMAAIYAERTGMAIPDVAALLMPKGKDVWLSATKMVELGLAQTKTKGSLLRNTVALKDLRKDTDPESILSRFNAALTEDELNIENESKNDEMSKEFAKSLGLAETATQDEINAAVVKLKGERDSAVAKVTEIEAAEDARLSGEFDGLVDGLVKANTITLAQKDDLVKQSKGNVAVALSMAKAMSGAMKPHVPASTQLGKDSASAKRQAERADWTYNDYATKDPKALAEMRDTDKASFEKLRAERPRAQR